MTYTRVVLAGRYRLESPIAGGGVGEVWRAADLVLARPVAVKVLRPEYAQHPQTLARFRTEAKHAASVSHPGVAQVYDYGEDGTVASPYLVMELVDGPSLAGVLEAGPLDPGFTLDVLAQAAAGLKAAHAAGLVHRDVKPGNLLVGPGGQVKITDFGIAYAAGSAPVTQVGTLVGTPVYLAPERAAGLPATPASDLYSLGVVGYECLAGVPPFRGMPAEVAAAHQGQAMPPLPRSVPADVAGLIAELMAKDPADRPASAGEVAARATRLRHGLAGGAVAGLGSRPGGPMPATRADAEPVTLVGLPAPDLAPAPQGPRRERVLPRRGTVLTAVGAAAVTALAGWLLAGWLAAPPAGAPHPAARTPSAQDARTVQVNAGALVGQPVGLVIGRLRQLGLHPSVVWAASGAQEPGTVISVRPGGQLPVGSTVIVTAARRPPGHHHDHGNGNGDGGNNGPGGGD